MEDYIFRKGNEEYSRALNPVKDYVEQMTYFLHKEYGYPKDIAFAKVKKIISGSKIKNPIIKYQYKDENGDLDIGELKLLDYIEDTIKNNEIIVPSFTTYVNPSKKKSLHSEFISSNVINRSKYKKAAFKAKQDNDTAGYMFNNCLQKKMKINNNSLSGAYGSGATVLFNPSAHYTLTSIIRCMSSIGNAITESLVAGNKHLRSPEITYSYITGLLYRLDKNTIEFAISKYNLYIPTTQEVMDKLILENIEPYWRDSKIENELYNYISKLEDYERVALLYTNDLWNIKNFNESLVRDLVSSLSRKVTGVTDDVKYLKDETIEILSKVINAELIKGKNVNYNELKGTETLFALASTAKNISEVLSKYRLLFRAFFVTDVLPISVAYIKDMLRSSVILSDTDSTCGTYGKWVEWYYGKTLFGEEPTAIAFTIAAINSQVIDHGLKILVNNMNMSLEAMDLIKMKNEFFWPVFTVANVNKHYFASTTIQEGNVYNKPDLELKGVHFIASTANKEITGGIHNLIINLNEDISNNKKISIKEYGSKIADLERTIIKRIKAGDVDIYKKDKIKSKNTYKGTPALSPYFHHMLWEEVFADKYGHIQEPPYDTIKVPTILDNKKKLDEWIESIEEPMKTKLINFLNKHNKTSLGTIKPPIPIVAMNGLPEEIGRVIDIYRIVNDNMLAGYYFLETIGLYKKEGILICDMGY